MDKMTYAVINGKETPLFYSVDVMFDVNDRFGDVRTAIETLDRDDKEAFEAVRWMAVRMANEAELIRREEGYDHETMLTEKDITPHMKVKAFAELKNKVADAIAIGYGQEIEEAEKKEVDLGLQEINSKKGKAKG